MENVHFYFPLLDHFYIDIYKYHTFLHHSQTLEAANETYKSLNTIHFYIILKRIYTLPDACYGLNTIHFYIILKLASMLSIFSCSFEYHTFLHHSQTTGKGYKNYAKFEYHTFLHHSQTGTEIEDGICLFEYHTFLHHSQTLTTSVTTVIMFEYHTFLHHSQTR